MRKPRGLPNRLARGFLKGTAASRICQRQRRRLPSLAATTCDIFPCLSPKEENNQQSRPTKETGDSARVQTPTPLSASSRCDAFALDVLVPMAIVVAIIINQLAFPGFFTFMNGEGCDDEARYRVDPGCARQTESNQAKKS